MEILFIPVKILNNMALWLSQQQNEDGAFVETSDHYYDRSFWVNSLSGFGTCWLWVGEYIVAVCKFLNALPVSACHRSIA